MGSLLTFVNTVADEVARRHPGARIGTLSCQYSRKPPRFLKPRPNVQIQLCSIECSVLQPMDEAAVKVNAAFADDLRGWARICEDISIWTYNTNFRNYLLPCPNLRVIEPNIRFFVANNVRGIYMQGAYHAMGAEFSELRNYVTSRLLWDPNQSGAQLIEEFARLHYRSAARPILRFINLIHDNAAEKGIQRHCFGAATHYGIDDSVVRAGLDSFEEARRLADDEVVGRYFEFLRAHEGLYREIESVADIALVYPRKAVHRGDVSSIPDFKHIGRLLTRAHVQFDVVVDEQMTERRRRRYRHLIHPRTGGLTETTTEPLRSLLASESVVDAPDDTVCVVWHQPGHNRILIHLVDHGTDSEGAKEPGVSGVGDMLRLRLRLPDRQAVPRAWCVSPDEWGTREIDFNTGGDFVTIRLRPAKVYTVAVIEFDDQ